MRESRADADLLAERTDAHQIIRAEPGEELIRRGAQQRQVALHAPRDVQHLDQPHRLRCVVEDRDRLRPPVVADFEIVARKRRHEPAVPVGDGDEHLDGVAGAAEDGRLLRRGAERG